MITTKDFNLAALLVANNIILENYSTDDLGQMWFEFPDNATSRQLEREFNLATVMVNLYQLTSASKMLKTLIYQNRRHLYEHKLGKLDFNSAR
jgi:hypothetical protein